MWHQSFCATYRIKLFNSYENTPICKVKKVYSNDLAHFLSAFLHQRLLLAPDLNPVAPFQHLEVPCNQIINNSPLLLVDRAHPD